MARVRNVQRIACLVLVAAVLVGPSVLASHPVPINEGPQFYSLGLDAIDRWLKDDGLFASNELLDRFFVEDQMIAVLAKLRAASLQIDQRTQLQAEALDLWTRSQVAYDVRDQFYNGVI